MKPGPKPLSPAERFWPKVEKSATCWLWTGCTNDYGHGVFNVGQGKRVRAHVFAYTTLIGPVPNGMELDHVRARGCISPACVNPAHLEPVTHRVNVLRGHSPAARHATTTHCPQGHEYTSENTYVDPDGYRNCRQCIKAAGVRQRAARTPERHERQKEYWRRRELTPEQREAKNARQRARRAEKRDQILDRLIGAEVAA